MHLHRIDLNLLVVLDAIFSEGGITRAGAKLNLTQPAISHALGRLRERFGDPLFVREGRRMVPTPMARKLIEPVRRALHGLEVALNEVQQFDPASSQRHFNVAVRDVLEALVLPDLMQRITTAAPSVDVSAIRADRRTLESELSAGRLDAALDIRLPMSADIRHQRISTDRLVVVVARDNPLCERGLDLAGYLRAHHVLVSSRRAGPALEDVELNRQGLRRRVRLRCQHYFAACRAVSQTGLLLTMPERYAQIANRQYGNRILPLPFDVPSMDVYLYWHAGADGEPSNRWLREQLIAAVSSQPAS